MIPHRPYRGVIGTCVEIKQRQLISREAAGWGGISPARRSRLTNGGPANDKLTRDGPEPCAQQAKAGREAEAIRLHS